MKNWKDGSRNWKQIIGKCWLDMVSAEHQAIAKEAEARRAKRHTDRYEITLHHKDGHKFPVLIGAGPRFDKQSGEFIGTMGVVNDITERKRVEETIHKSHEILKLTEAMANIGSWEWDVQHDQAHWSEELFRMFGRDPAEGAPPFAEQTGFYANEDMQRLRKAVDRCIKQGTPYEIELRAIRADGEIRHCVSMGKAQYGKDGKVLRLVGSFQDITERKQAEEALRESQNILNITGQIKIFMLEQNATRFCVMVKLSSCRDFCMTSQIAGRQKKKMRNSILSSTKSRRWSP